MCWFVTIKYVSYATETMQCWIFIQQYANIIYRLSLLKYVSSKTLMLDNIYDNKIIWAKRAK